MGRSPNGHRPEGSFVPLPFHYATKCASAPGRTPQPPPYRRQSKVQSRAHRHMRINRRGWYRSSSSDNRPQLLLSPCSAGGRECKQPVLSRDTVQNPKTVVAKPVGSGHPRLSYWSAYCHTQSGGLRHHRHRNSVSNKPITTPGPSRWCNKRSYILSSPRLYKYPDLTRLTV